MKTQGTDEIVTGSVTMTVYRYRYSVPPVTSAGAGRQVRADAAARLRQSPAALAPTTRRDTPHYYRYIRHVRGATLNCCSKFEKLCCVTSFGRD